MLALLGRHRPDFLFQEPFLQQLPLPVRAALANSAITDCRELAEEAAKFFLARQQSYTAALRPAQATAWLPGETVVIATAAAASKRQIYRPVLLPC